MFSFSMTARWDKDKKYSGCQKHTEIQINNFNKCEKDLSPCHKIKFSNPYILQPDLLTLNI